MINQTKVGKHALRITIGVLGGLGAIYIDNVAAKSDRAMIQMALWTFVLFAYSIVELRQSLRRIDIKDKDEILVDFENVFYWV